MMRSVAQNTARENLFPSIAVIITAQRRPDLLRRTLEAVRQLETEPSELLVVVSGEHDPAVPAVAEEFGARIIFEARGGLSRARNCGARNSVSDIVAYLDDDALPDPGWLNALMNEFSINEVGAVAGKVRAPAGPESEALNLAIFMGLAYSGGEERLDIDRTTEYWLERAHFGGIEIGPNMAFRRSLFDEWEGFDERIGAGTLFHGGEEGKAFAEILERGYRVIYTPLARVTHPSILFTGQVLRERYRASLRAQTAYLTLLLVEEHRHRRRLMAYLVQGLFRRSRPWRAVADIRPQLPLGRLLRFQAYCMGPILYLRTRLLHRRSTPPS
jgi:glycosyltransferase involved in cell wall biosynthesis